MQDEIAILGAGQVGSALGRRWSETGRPIVFGVRDPGSDKIRRLVDSLDGKARAAAVPDAAASAAVILLATPWSNTLDAVRAAGALQGKILIDATNPLAPGLTGLEFGHTTSAAEKIAAAAPGARVVKAFNCIGAKSMLDPKFGAFRADMFICGDDPEAKTIVAGLGRVIGFDMIDAGPLTSARLLEPLAMLWIDLALKQGLGEDIGFKLLRR